MSSCMPYSPCRSDPQLGKRTVRCVAATTLLCGKPFPPPARMNSHVTRPSGLVGSGVANVNTRMSCKTEASASKAVSTNACAGNMLVTSNARIASSVETGATSTLAGPRRIGTGREDREKRWACPRCTRECLPQADVLTQRGVATRSPNHLPSKLENLKLRWDWDSWRCAGDFSILDAETE